MLPRPGPTIAVTVWTNTTNTLRWMEASTPSTQKYGPADQPLQIWALHDVGSAAAKLATRGGPNRAIREPRPRRASCTGAGDLTPRSVFFDDEEGACRKPAKATAADLILVGRTDATEVQGPPSTTLVRHDRGAGRPRPVDRGRLRRLLGAALPQTAARRDRALHPANWVPLGLPVLGRGRGGGRAHAVGLCRRIDYQPRRVRPEPKSRVPADGAVPSDPRRARARDNHARRPRRLELVILWSLLAPLGAVAFDRPVRAWPWFAAFVAVVLLAVVLSEVVRPDGANLP